ncbi:hydrolase [Saccharopolyspora indica]|uniref:alpha/beta hydrolase family protein n=1 Tax=Saccharopolyspora indica TaxID=1229659 RepID=UPI0022EACD93|nr:hydrolase [Saccharopolyspora indica]MDA3650159.1 hydrolase [Saccharopolyspora indica]
MIGRRLFLAGLAVTATAATAAAGIRQQVRLELPAPTGPHRVGITDLHLIDTSRPDPWAPEKPFRELMVSVRYPARRVGGHPVAPHMSRALAEHFARTAAEGTVAIPPQIPVGTVDWAATRTHSHRDAPVELGGGPLPVLLHSPGHLMSRAFGSLLAEELASHGYAVVALDHTHDPTEVEFPGGRIEVNRQADPESFETFKREMAIRVVDVGFVLDQLGSRILPGALDLGSIGMYGHSLGGATTAQSMHDHPRITAGVDLDGPLGTREDPWGTVVPEGLDQPFLLFTADPSDQGHELISEFWSNLRGWRRALQMVTAAHNSFNDLVVFAPQLREAGVLSPQQMDVLVGATDPADPRADAEALRTYVRAFFDLHLRNRDEGLLDGPSPAYPQVRFTG